MKQYQTDTQILNLIGQLKYATIRNLYSRRSNSWHASNLHIKSLLKQELIEPVPSNYRLFSIYREQFYRLSRKGARETGLKYKEYRLRASVRHESAKVDVALSFISISTLI